MANTRKGKRSRKFMGTRNHGKGNAKNRRGSGSKGGWGNSGLGKHNFTWITAKAPEWFGVHGFAALERNKDLPTINLYEIEQMASDGKLKTEGGKLAFTFEGKVLGGGKLAHAVRISAEAASEGAAEKIKKAGGELVLPAEEKKEAKPQEKKAEAKPQGKKA
jgi:large subunit ribosomal protein L15